MMVDLATEFGKLSWFGVGEMDPGYLLDFSRALLAKVDVQTSVRDFRRRPLKATNYLLDEKS
jgi:hypothetical protein